MPEPKFELIAMLLSFLFTFILAYFLNGYTTRLSILIGSRAIASLCIVTLLSILVIAIFLLAVPLLYRQLVLFLKGVPQLLIYLEKNVKTTSPNLYNFLETQGISSVLEYVLSILPQLSANITKHLWDSTLAIANVIILLVFAPVILFYLLIDWPTMAASVKELIPPKYRDTFDTQLQLVDASISGYILGQAKVSIILMILYTVLLFFAGMPYYFLLGVSIGLLTIIPYLGNITGLVVTHLIALSYASSLLDILPITLTFIVCGIIETMFLSPKLLGKSVNLHPVWIIFSITIGGMLFGFVGILLSVPLASILAGFIRLGVSCYKNSSYYRDEAADTH